MRTQSRPPTTSHPLLQSLKPIFTLPLLLYLLSRSPNPLPPPALGEVMTQYPITIRLPTHLFASKVRRANRPLQMLLLASVFCRRAVKGRAMLWMFRIVEDSMISCALRLSCRIAKNLLSYCSKGLGFGGSPCHTLGPHLLHYIEAAWGCVCICTWI